MSTPNPYNIEAQNPEDLIYVSKKHWARKINVENNNSLGGIIDRPGPISGIIISLIDMIVTLFLKLIFYVIDIATYAFNWTHNISFGNFQGIIPNSYGKGKVISSKFFRYTMNLLLPPFGIMLSKGIYGWFNILICILITYVNFIAGIVYAFVITSRNRYADQYEQYQFNKFEAENPPEEVEADITALQSSLGFIILVAIFLYLCLSYF